MSDEPKAKEAASASPDASKADAKPKARRAASVPRSYPRKTLEDSLRVATAIKDKNGGKPWSPSEVATAVKLGAKSGNFYYLTAASRDFGLTEGSRDTTEISITPLGERVVSPTTPEDHEAALREAFFKVDTFRKVFQHYSGNKLPEEPFLSNTLSDSYSVDRGIVPEFVDLFGKNATFVGYPSGASEDAQFAAAVADQPGGTETVAKPRASKGTGLVQSEQRRSSMLITCCALRSTTPIFGPALSRQTSTSSQLTFEQRGTTRTQLRRTWKFFEAAKCPHWVRRPQSAHRFRPGVPPMRTP